MRILSLPGEKGKGGKKASTGGTKEKKVKNQPGTTKEQLEKKKTPFRSKKKKESVPSRSAFSERKGGERRCSVPCHRGGRI